MTRTQTEIGNVGVKYGQDLGDKKWCDVVGLMFQRKLPQNWACLRGACFY